MKVKSADLLGWSRVLARRFVVKRIESQEYRGYVTLCRFDEVQEPLYKKPLHAQADEQRVCLVDRGYTWLRHFPDGAHYTLLTAFDENGELVEWYIDVVGRVGIDDHGIPWYEDLYLDIVVSPAGETLLLDSDELDEALRLGEVTQSEYSFAWREASTLLDALEADMLPLLWLSEPHRALLDAEMDAER